MPSPFSPDYTTARQRFLAAAQTLGCAIESHTIAELGPNGEPLAIDVAITSGTNDQTTLVISSGLHGVEGFFGSAVQLAVLELWQQTSLPNTRCVLIHALNPYGFAWRRRVNEENVDLNRNFLLADETFEGAPPGYAELDELLNPRHPPRRWEPVQLKFLLAIARHGMSALKQIVPVGQYQFPQGLFFGGHRPSASSAILRAHFNRWVGTCNRVLHLDLHTGLGPGGKYLLVPDHFPDEATRERLAATFGRDVFKAADPAGGTYRVRGSLGPWCREQLPDRDYLYLLAEFGTYPVTQVLAGLRAENQATQWGAPNRVETEHAKEHLMGLFCPASPSWRSGTIEAGLTLVERAIAGFAE